MLLSISLRLDLQRSNFFEFHKKTRESLGHDEATSKFEDHEMYQALNH